MRPRPSPLILVLLASCATLSGRARANPPASRAVGTFGAQLALTGRSTYVGSLQLAATSADSVRGSLRLTSPVPVDAVLSGIVRSDSLILSGSYTGANGCAGDMRASLAMPTDRTATGPFQLADKCAGTLSGTMTVTR